jgi:thioredoxin reductase (NADPH)
VHYVHDAPLSESALAGGQLVVLGGDESAVLTALELAQPSPHMAQPARVTLVHRRDVFGGDSQTLAALEAARISGTIHVIAGQVTGCAMEGTRLNSLQLLTAEGTSITLPADHVLVRLGVAPKMGPIADWGWALERKQVPVNTENFQSEIPGIFAVGDINTYPGKRKLILCGFHEATLAAFGAMPLIAPGREVHLQYTTTSPRLHKLLGGGTAP